MSDIEALMKQAVGELDRLLDAKNVMGEPTQVGSATVIPLVSFGFGFGAGGGTDAKSGGSGTGGGGGIKPQAVIIADGDGVRVQSTQAGASMMKSLGEAIGTAIGARKADSADDPGGR